METLPLRLLRTGSKVQLASPGVGTFTCALDPGRAVVPGQPAGVLTTLGRSTQLIVPEGVHGIVTSERPELVRAPVGWGTVLYELAPLEEGSFDAEPEPEERHASGALVFGAPSSGRFYRRPAPDAPSFADEGATLENGAPFGLIEIMKTFHQIHYRPKGSLPKRATLVRFLTEDGVDVRAGDPLIEVAPA